MDANEKREWDTIVANVDSTLRKLRAYEKENAKLRRLLATRDAAPKKRSFAVGDKVKARYGREWFSGTVVEETDEGVDVLFPKDESVVLFEAPKYAGLRMVRRAHTPNSKRARAARS